MQGDRCFLTSGPLFCTLAWMKSDRQVPHLSFSVHVVHPLHLAACTSYWEWGYRAEDGSAFSAWALFAVLPYFGFKLSCICFSFPLTCRQSRQIWSLLCLWPCSIHYVRLPRKTRNLTEKVCLVFFHSYRHLGPSSSYSSVSVQAC